ncbi:hypothetical protein BX600DRAFT_468074 [Xylariales sp. PMI_506]|nr:hypothetical protein BX600DRAFT_468074 [Xylariales sp. PMI_506]
MSRTPVRLEQSIHASIEIPDLKLSYAPGDIVNGVVKKVNIGSYPEPVTAVLQLILRVETQVVTHTKNSNGDTTTHHHTGERKIIDRRQQVYSGLAQPGINVWPFSIAIPTEPLLVHGQELVPLPEPLPPTIYRGHESDPGPSRGYLYAEYFLETHIYGALASSWSSSKPAVSTYPLYIRPRSTPEPIADFAPRALAFDEYIKTLHLDPQYAETGLTFGQHMKSIFHRSSLPCYRFSLIVGYPSVIQLEHPEPISFRLRTKVNKNPQLTTPFLAEKPPALRLVSFRLRLQSATHTSDLDGRSSHVTNPFQGAWHDTHLLEWVQGEDTDGPVIPEDTTEVPGGNPGLDMGQSSQLRISARRASLAKVMHSELFSKPLYPSFTTRHVTHEHRLAWRVVVSCAGKERKIAGEAPITLLGPSERDEQARNLRVSAEGIAKAHKAWATCKDLAADGVEMSMVVDYVDSADMQRPNAAPLPVVPPFSTSAPPPTYDESLMASDKGKRTPAPQLGATPVKG